MRNPVLLLALLAVCAAGLPAQRAASGTLHVTAQIEGSMSVVFAAESMAPVRATGSTSASFSVPTVGGSFSGRSPAAADGESSFLVSEPFAITVHKANLDSSSYTLNASLATPDAARIWKIDGVALRTGIERPVAIGEFYGSANAHALVVSGPAAGPVNFGNAINFLIVAN
jgi:hypothetical protein